MARLQLISGRNVLGNPSAVHILDGERFATPTLCGLARRRTWEVRWGERSEVTCKICLRVLDGEERVEQLALQVTSLLVPQEEEHAHVWVWDWRCEHTPTCNDYPCERGRWVEACRCGEDKRGDA